MIAKEQIQRITDIAQEKGWSVNVEDKNETRVLFEFQRYTKYGQDFLFNADMQGEDIDTLIASVKEYYEGFDPDYEAYLWIGDDGHGKNGAPYHIKDIVADMEDAEEQTYIKICDFYARLIKKQDHPLSLLTNAVASRRSVRDHKFNGL